MDKLNGLEAMFYNEIMLHDARHDARNDACALISRVLNRQSLTEVPTDDCRGLKRAIKLAKECEVHLNHQWLLCWILNMMACSTHIHAIPAGSAAL